MLEELGHRQPQPRAGRAAGVPRRTRGRPRAPRLRARAAAGASSRGTRSSALADDVLLRHGFEVDIEHLTIEGRCADCRAARLTPRPRRVDRCVQRRPGPRMRSSADARADAPAVNQGPKQLKGRKLGDRRVRIERPHAAYFRYTPGGHARRQGGGVGAADAGRAGLFARVRGVLFGRPLSIHEEITERLSKTKALAIFSSDPISSSAYATEEILRVLVLAGAGALFLSLPIAAGDRAAPGGRRDQLPPDRPRLPVGRRRLRRRAPQPAGLGVARRRRRAARRLRDDRRRLDRVGRRAGHLRGAGARTTGSWSSASTAIALITIGNLRGPARVREHLRDPDVPVRRLGAAHDRDRRVPGRRQRRGRAAGPRGPRRRRTRSRRRASSCSSGPSRPARSR